MTDEPAPPVNRMAELPTETREFLSDLSREDIETFKAGLPIIRAIIGFSKVTRFIAITSLGLLLGMVMLWDAIARVIGWFSPPPPH